MMVTARDTQTISSLLNFKHAKAFVFVIMLGFMMYHGFLMLTRPGSNLCKSLLSYGNTVSTGEWRPFGCMTHSYSPKDSHMCLDQLSLPTDITRLYFIGDSRLFTLFEAFAKHLNRSWPTLPKPSQLNGSFPAVLLKADRFVLCFLHHTDNSFDTVALLNFWKNIQLVNALHEFNRSALKLSEIQLEHECFRHPPTHLVLSFGTETIKRYNLSDVGLLNYQRTLEALGESLSPMLFKHTVWMLQDPVAEGLLSDEYLLITNKDIDSYNNVACRVLKTVPGLEIWRSNRLIAQRVGFPAVNWHCPELDNLMDQPPNGTSVTVYNERHPNCTEPPRLSDGFHVSSEAMYQNMQVLLNLYCNNRVKFEDGTCCRSAEPISLIQKRCFILICLCLASTLLCFIYDTVLRFRVRSCFPFMKKFRMKRFVSCASSCTLTEDIPGKASEPPPSGKLSDTNVFDDFYEFTSALSKFGLVLIYFFVCDRTILFMKVNKGFTIVSFILPLTYVGIVGLFFNGSTKETRINHVDITREWKGWMQVYFLIYHLTGSYRIVPLYLFTRYFVSAYLFLSGFGHFHYMWHQRLPASFLCQLIPFRFSLRGLLATAQAWWRMLYRYIQVMYRMNFFVFGLCLVMNRDYMFYYFMPLVSFWFTVTMVMMLVFPRVSAYGAKAHNDEQTDQRSAHEHFDSECNYSRRDSADHPFGDGSISDALINPTIFTRSSEAIDSRSSPCSLNCSNDHFFLTSGLASARCLSHASSLSDYKKHQKIVSLGRGFDARQQFKPPSVYCAPAVIRKNKVTKSGPPWTEDFSRRTRQFNFTTPAETPPIRLNEQSISRSSSGFILSNCFCCHLRLLDLVILIKLVLLAVGVELLAQSPAAFHWLFFSGPHHVLFRLDTTAPNPMEPYDDNARRGEQAWFYRWSIDRYSAIFGMVFALLCEWGRRSGFLSDLVPDDLGLPTACARLVHGAPTTRTSSVTPTCDSIKPFQPSRSPTTDRRSFMHHLDDMSLFHETGPQFHPLCTNLHLSDFSVAPFVKSNSSIGFLTKMTFRRFTAILLTLTGLIGIGVSVLIAFRCTDRTYCANVHAFLCLLPILSYILVRNCLGVFRRNFSVFFAWIGDISLELFIAQHHIWLSADGNGILVLLPGYPLLNLALTSFIFVCICCEVRNLTARLQRFVIPNSPLLLVRNLILFGATFYLLTKASGFE